MLKYELLLARKRIGPRPFVIASS